MSDFRRWKNSQERGVILEQDCERFCARLELLKIDEQDGHGRWFMRGPWSWVEVVTLTNGIYVGGDIETVVFLGGSDRANSPRGRVYWMATRSYGYAAEKAHHGRTAPDEWDADCARGDILWHRRVDQLEKDDARHLWDYLKNGDVGGHELNSEVYERTRDSELCTLGQVTAKSLFMATAALRRLAYLFDCRDMQQASREWFRRAA